MATYKEFHQYSIEKPNEFWTEQAQLIDWKEPFTQVCDYSKPHPIVTGKQIGRAHV